MRQEQDWLTKDKRWLQAWKWLDLQQDAMTTINSQCSTSTIMMTVWQCLISCVLVCSVYRQCKEGRLCWRDLKKVQYWTFWLKCRDPAANWETTASLSSSSNLHVQNSHSRHAFKVCAIKKLMLAVVFIQLGTFHRQQVFKRAGWL